MKKEQMQKALAMAANRGRAEDDTMAHVATGEMVIPNGVLPPELEQAIADYMAQAGLNPAQYVVGSGENSINPETGQPEYFLKRLVPKPLRKAASVAVPIAASILAPGIGTAASSALGLGLGKVGAATLGGALAGGAGSALTGGNPLQGAALGGAGGALGAGVLGSAGAPLPGGVGPTPQSGILGGLSSLGSTGSTLASGIQNFAQAPFSTLGNALTGAVTGSPISTLGMAANVYSGIQGTQAYKDAMRQQMAALERGQQMTEPFRNTGVAANQQLATLLGIGQNTGDPNYGEFAREFSLSDFESDPGYQFRLQEGQRAIDRARAARGGFFSGDALREAQQFGQGLAAQTFDDSYRRWLQQRQQQTSNLQNLAGTGANMTGLGATLAGGVGDVQAAGGIARQNVINQTIANVLGQNVGGALSPEEQRRRALLGIV
jgi:hypothetical protein